MHLDLLELEHMNAPVLIHRHALGLRFVTWLDTSMKSDLWRVEQASHNSMEKRLAYESSDMYYYHTYIHAVFICKGRTIGSYAWPNIYEQTVMELIVPHIVTCPHSTLSGRCFLLEYLVQITCSRAKCPLGGEERGAYSRVRSLLPSSSLFLPSTLQVPLHCS